MISCLRSVRENEQRSGFRDFVLQDFGITGA